jgi:nitric oxide reductase activation protein
VVEKRPAGRLPARAGGPSADGLLPRLSRPWSRRLNRARRLRRQWEGDDIDLNAAIEVLIDRRLDLAPDARLFMRMGRARARSSLLVLLDLSESANDRVGGTMRSILDVEKEAAILLAASIDAATERIAVHGFSSDTRSNVRYLRLLDFGTSHDDLAALARIRGVQASLSTRMGAALRRATEHVALEPGEQRAIFVVTDGAPSDVDVSDDDYLIEDARVAVQEARRRGVDVLCAAIDPDGEDYVRRIFGWRNYRIVDDPRSLPKQLTALCARWVAR